MPKFYIPPRTEWISLVGPDAADFLHRLSTVNVHALQVGAGARGAFLNAQGKFRAAFFMWRYGENEFGFETSMADAIMKTIDQFTFAEKMKLTRVTALQCIYIFEDSRFNLPAMTTQLIDDEIQICNHGDLDFGHPLITAWGNSEWLMQWLERTYPDTAEIKKYILNDTDIAKMQIEACRPSFENEMNEESNPLEVGAPDYVAINKGCYPGQEIIEKIQALGSPARRLVEIEGELKLDEKESLPSQGLKLLNTAEPPSEVGFITRLYKDPSSARFKALAILRKNYINAGLELQAQVENKTFLTAKIVKAAPYQ